MINDLFLHSFIKGAGKTIGAFFIMGIAGSVWHFYTNQENYSLFKKPKTINSKKDEHHEHHEQIKTTYLDIEQIDNEINDEKNKFDNSKIRALFDTLIR